MIIPWERDPMEFGGGFWNSLAYGLHVIGYPDWEDHHVRKVVSDFFIKYQRHECIDPVIMNWINSYFNMTHVDFGKALNDGYLPRWSYKTYMFIVRVFNHIWQTNTVVYRYKPGIGEFWRKDYITLGAEDHEYNADYVIAKSDEQLHHELKEKGYQTRGKVVRYLNTGEQEKVEVEWPNQQVGGEPLLQEVEKGKVQSASFVYLLYTDGLGTEAMHFDALLPYDLPKYKASVPNPFTDPPDGEEYFFQEDFIPDIFMARIGPRQEGDEDWVKLDQGWYAKDNSQTAEVCMLVVIALIAFSAITFAVFRLHRGASDHPGLGEVDKVIRHENVKSWTEHSRVSSATDA
eukprot:gnl/MRDRNA2_/MRDRNA2_56011_c0_seq2.p1 gnl/MRDRNA2_/MRDRNA2_56011_c0~~gnl/MRDRNA2_/MRDRNA2_56011_c0_seq2.p1  ORF type:complete len:402 (+),score=45.61 gnl/MRDRNA2_/MRDRNA2_56011_c0_seq2:171-1208(+)